MAKSAPFVWLDGKLVSWEQATMHVATECVLRGENVFEGIRAYWSEAEQELFLFRHADHIARLRQGAKIMRMTIPYSDTEIEAASLELIRACGYSGQVHYRPVAYFDMGNLTDYLPSEIRTGMFILAFSMPTTKAVHEGVASCVSTWRRNSDLASPSRIKAGSNYHNSRLAYIDARLNGFQIPILLNEAGKVAEGPGACFMMVRHGKLITPPVTADILESITRETLIELARAELGLEVIERDIDRTELYICDEAFFCGSGHEVTPINSVDRYEVGDGKPGPLTRRIQKLYFDVVSGAVPQYRHWLRPVLGGAARASAAE
ncbi:branched-chain amino acid aminotransferase [Falsiroseomonas bella]|uniref:Branched-chain-amino-acid aminotransferase n=1 Tax=Falsiroseomonas bella TaxID=2184016 RepID=A0A317FDH0_9PROT|nr:branched-chain amino acid transaminase [Falsiroseomonas bella]PWS35596.1 branched-chain amino acid aminotransferase [Falsiroseomonas bella]